MRGEDSLDLARGTRCGGSPPHARGRLKRLNGVAGVLMDHPRMRGEDVDADAHASPRAGSPPHARGRLPVLLPAGNHDGITPACAGKTEKGLRAHTWRSDHPRMRGEDDCSARGDHRRRGSPPHARGRRDESRIDSMKERITPACAGKTVRFPRESDKTNC